MMMEIIAVLYLGVALILAVIFLDGYGMSYLKVPAFYVLILLMPIWVLIGSLASLFGALDEYMDVALKYYLGI